MHLINDNIQKLFVLCRKHKVDRLKEHPSFCNDTLFRRGVERNIGIMGEAMNQVLKINPGIPITAARKVVDTRNFGIVINHMPLLRTEI